MKLGEMAGSAAIAIGLTFDGRIIGERLPVCVKCLDIAEKSEESAALVQEAISLRYEFAKGATKQSENDEGALH
ncbi:MAG: hypothetical protein Q8L71_11335 [Thiobacillus sp.]|nr:hypothetical protein [Thiobacillus sp.]